MLILALESSTVASKAALFDSECGILAVETHGGISPEPEGAYQELISLAKRVSEGRKIDAVALGGTWHNVAVCDADMQPVTRTYSWLDTDAAPTAARLRADDAFTDYYYRTCGCMVHTTYAPFKLLHMRSQGLDLSGKLITDQGSYTFYRMTGKRLRTASMASGMGLLNIRKLEYEPEAMKTAGVTADQLGDLCTYRDYGYLSESAAAEIGLPSGTPVMPAFPDGALNQMGADAMRPGIMTLSVGTSAAMRRTTPAPWVSDCRSTWCYVSVLDTWLSGAATAGSCNCIDWVKKQLLRGQYTYRELEDPNCDFAALPFFLPFLYGERCPGWNDARLGGYHDIKPHHGASDFFISAMEGVLFNIKQCYDILGKPEKIMVSGGILKSVMWRRMLADILGEVVYCADMEQCSLVGGAKTAALALGAEVTGASGVVEAVSPRDEAVGLFRERYERYLELYKGSVVTLTN